LVFNVKNNGLTSIDYKGKRTVKQYVLTSKEPVVGARPTSSTTKVPASDPMPLREERTLIVHAGDNIITMAQRAKLPGHVIQGLHKHSNKLQAIKPQDKITVQWSSQGVLHDVALQRGSKITSLIKQFQLQNTRPQTHQTGLKLVNEKQHDNRFVALHIKKNFRQDGVAAGIPLKVISTVEDIFAKDKKTSALLKPGSRLEVIYGQNTKQPLIYANLSQGKTQHEAILFEGKNGAGYYNAKGLPYAQGFLRIPVASERISSHFSLGRKHPILRRVRPHTGVDFAAKIGTPVWASAPGKVIFAGNQRGYGRSVVIQHSPKVKTLYAHLSKFEKNITVGKQVSQRETIGYVGRSGLSTGPHLHYEYIIDNQPRDPMTVALPASGPLSRTDHSLLLAARQRFLALKNSPTA
jgi:murein DD-endopeptidase MepM/ murein hydrolase activator NlpD